MKLVVGLGNPGAKYEGTRHNVGFQVIERLVRETGAVQRREQKPARGIACEHAPGSVRAMRPRSETNHQDARVRIAKPGHRPAPIFLVAVSFPLDPRHLLAPLYQPGALVAMNDFFVKLFKFGLICHVFLFSPPQILL